MTPASESRPPENRETPSYSVLSGWAFAGATVSATKFRSQWSPLRKDRALTNSDFAAPHSATSLTGTLEAEVSRPGVRRSGPLDDLVGAVHRAAEAQQVACDR